MKQLTKAQMKRVRDARSKLLKKCDFVSTAAGVLVHDNPKKDKLETGYVCHAFLRSWNDPESNRYAVVSALMTDYKGSHGPGRWDNNTPRERQTYMHWLLNQSPYASVFITKSAAHALKTKAVIVSGYTPSNLMAAGLCASRRLWEHSKVVKIFCELAKRGVDKNLAFLLAHCADCGTAPNDTSPFTWNNALSNHCSVEMRGMTFKEVRNFMAAKLQQANKDYYESNDYYGYDRMYQPVLDNSPTFYNYLKASFPYNECKEEAQAADLNPFRAAAVAKPNSYPMAKVLDVTAKWCKEHLMEKIANA